MKEIFESLLGAIMVALITIVCTCCISTSIDARNVDASVQAYTVEIEHSNFSPTVMANVFSQADSDGYKDLSMKLYERDTDGNQTTRMVKSASAVGNTHRVYMVELTMNYDFTLDFLTSSTSSHTVTAYAR